MSTLGQAMLQQAALKKLRALRDRRKKLLAELDALAVDRALMIRTGREQGAKIQELQEAAGIRREGIYEALRNEHRPPSASGRRPGGTE